ncbi:MAG: MoaD/ThiS family protein [Actinobacteria bacterium]|nr:MoaD/ThiS family protein [Actinomycetota bacterium]MCI0545262.1 MoaD/ThiS family protein [Actinomycetota bacterium]
MTSTVRLPRVLAMTANTDLRHVVNGDTVETALESLFGRQPGLRSHLLDETGEIRPHVSVFVDGRQAALVTPVTDGSEIYVLQAVSGG